MATHIHHQVKVRSQSSSSRKDRLAVDGQEELEAADALILLSQSCGGFFSSQTNDVDTTSPSRSGPKNRFSLFINKSTPYKCNICGQQFSSPQALGGHQTRHRRAAGGNLVPSLRTFECSTCHQKFKSGPALGGHMRKHYNPNINVSTSNPTDRGHGSSSVVTDDGGSGDHTSRLRLDLNLRPPEED